MAYGNFLWCITVCFGLSCSILAGDEGKTSFATHVPSEEAGVAVEAASGTWNYILSIAAIPDIAVLYPLTETWRCGMKKEEKKGAFGVVLSGHTGKDFMVGWLNSLSLEPVYRKQDVYGVLTGLYGYADDTYGVMVSFVNRVRNSYGIQVSPFANLAKGGGGLSVSLLNRSETYSGLQVGLMNGFVLKKQGIVRVPVKSFSCGVQTGGVNVNLQNRSFSFQIGLFNRSCGGAFQIGFLNHAENAWIPWLPIINFCGFPTVETEMKASGTCENGQRN